MTLICCFAECLDSISVKWLVSTADNQLSEEIERLRYLQREGLCCSAREGNTENGQLNMSGRSQVGSGILNGSDVNVTRKRRRHYGTSADITVAPYSGDQLEHAPGRESASDLSKKTVSGGTGSVVDQVCVYNFTHSVVTYSFFFPQLFLPSLF